MKFPKKLRRMVRREVRCRKAADFVLACIKQAYRGTGKKYFPVPVRFHWGCIGGPADDLVLFFKEEDELDGLAIQFPFASPLGRPCMWEHSPLEGEEPWQGNGGWGWVN